MTAYEKLQRSLKRCPRKWLVTGAAGFIGSHLVETLLRLNQRVVGLDNFATGHAANLEDVRGNVTALQRRAFRFIEGDITEASDCKRACRGIDYVLHQAAISSVPGSFADPLTIHATNTTGFLNILLAARNAKVKRVVYASSSSIYGDHKASSKREAVTGVPLSPYAVSKAVNELYATVFANGYNQELVGLRYFNVFGTRQDPNGVYAAVIPRWILAMLKGSATEIYGDGKTSRDFFYVANVVQANLLGATGKLPPCSVYNVALGVRTNLNQLHRHLRRLTGFAQKPVYKAFRDGDVRHSLACTRAVRKDLGYLPSHSLEEGLDLTVQWFANQVK